MDYRLKTLIALLFAACADAQSNTIYSWTVQAAPTDTPVTINSTQDQSVAVPNWFFTQTLGTPSTLTASVTAVATTLTVATIPPGLIPGSGVCISPSASVCQMVMSTTGAPGNLTLSAGEIARITAVTGTGPYTLTVKRGSIGTATAYTLGQAVTFIKWGSYSDMVAAFIVNGQAPIVQNCAYNAFSTATQCAAITAAQAALSVVH